MPERLAETGGMTNDNALDDECAVKHCDEVATLGMTWRFGDVRIEFYVCERHFDEISAADEAATASSPSRAGRHFSSVAGDMWNELENLREHWEGTERAGFIQAHIDRYEELAGLTKPEPPAVKPECRAFHWIGQSLYHCENCSQPAWDHDGYHGLPAGASPFGSNDDGIVIPWEQSPPLFRHYATDQNTGKPFWELMKENVDV